MEAGRELDALVHKGKRYTVNVHGYYSGTSRGYKLLHRVLWEEAHGPIPHGMIVHHKNGIKTDNAIENLELVSRGEHTTHHHTGHRPYRPKTYCAEESCGRQSKARGLCTLHYQRERAKERGRWL